MTKEIKENVKDIMAMIGVGIVILAAIVASAVGIYAIGVIAAIMSF